MASRRRVESTRPASLGGALFVPAPRMNTRRRSCDARRSASHTSSIDAGSTSIRVVRGRREAERASEPLGQTRSFGWVLPIRARHFAAQARRGKYFARIAEPARIERAPEHLHRIEIRLG